MLFFKRFFKEIKSTGAVRNQTTDSRFSNVKEESIDLCIERRVGIRHGNESCHWNLSEKHQKKGALG